MHSARKNKNQLITLGKIIKKDILKEKTSNIKVKCKIIISNFEKEKLINENIMCRLIYIGVLIKNKNFTIYSFCHNYKKDIESIKRVIGQK